MHSLVNNHILPVSNGEILQDMHLAFGWIDGIIGHSSFRNHVIEFEFTHLFAQCLDNDSTDGNSQRVSARIGDFLIAADKYQAV